MKSCNRVIVLLTFVTAGVILALSQAEAAEGVSSGRKIWDNIMLWFNFGILVFLFIKFAKNPLMNFLRGQKEKIALNIENVEEQLRDKRSVLEAEEAKLANIDARIEEIKQRLIEIGMREKDELIEQARQQAERMIAKAEMESKAAVAAAKKQLNAELAEIAVSMVEERLRKALSSEDQDRLFEDFMVGLHGEKKLVRAMS